MAKVIAKGKNTLIVEMTEIELVNLGGYDSEHDARSSMQRYNATDTFWIGDELDVSSVWNQLARLRRHSKAMQRYGEELKDFISDLAFKDPVKRYLTDTELAAELVENPPVTEGDGI